MAIFDIYFGAFSVLINLTTIQVFIVSKMLKVIKGIDHGGFLEFDTVSEWFFIEIQMVGGIVLLVGVSLEWADEKEVVRSLVFIEFFLNFRESLRTCVYHFDIY